MTGKETRMLRVGHGSETSPKREQNQDAYRVYAEQEAVRSSGRGSILVVSDGLGGHRAGGDASTMAVDQLWLYFQVPGAQFHPTQTLARLVQAANRSIHDMGARSEAHKRMGATLSLVLFDSAFSHFMVVHVGDSRIYCVRDGVLRQVTEDHVDPLDDRVLMRRLGKTPEVVPQVLAGKVEPGDRWVLLTDGLFTVLSAEEMEQDLLSESSPEELSDRWLSRAARDGKDNVTVIIADVCAGA